MPARTKRVRFANTIAYYPPPNNVHPSSSTEPTGRCSSLRCSLSSLSLSHSARRIQFHAYLEMLVVTWDLNDPPSMITKNHRTIGARTFAEPATSPPMGFMTIAIESLPWLIKVYASYQTYITLEDVFQAIYGFLRTTVTRSEFNSISQNKQGRVTKAYEHRYRRQRCRMVYDEEKYAGIRRIDFLMGYYRFLCISNSCRPRVYCSQWSF